MQIETPFDLGDIVWLADGGDFLTGKIRSIRLNQVDSGIEVYYGLLCIDPAEGHPMHRSRSTHEIARTPEALADLLIAQAVERYAQSEAGHE
jgi:hypothetical protein